MLKRIAFSALFVVALASPLLADEVVANPLAAPHATPVEAATPATPAHAVEAAHAPAAEPAAEKKPELMELDISSAVWTLIIFGILLGVLYKGAWKNVLAGLKGREERIRNDIAQAEAARLKAEGTLVEYNAQLAKAEARAQEIIAKATADAVALADKIKSDADKAATERAARAAREIADASKQAIRDIYSQAADLSTNIAEKILRRNLNAGDQQDLVAQSLNQVETVNRG